MIDVAHHTIAPRKAKDPITGGLSEFFNSNSRRAFNEFLGTG
jgi:hypothetical protein